ncbi:Gfo/Idh/MocA family oxidoreductase [Streptomyces sp. SID8379]|uniref:Gfo/Idh/MocA family protein n=1 Tax=unclassified Streptomyces TaxID=2593676 RepID=UPI0003677286|nr:MULTISPECIES: Gfo/Idh/MocA family oxidoreductase [unclassified Streptomyces]MYW63158.1 Gfo/Idh/MocA family oxidoreductase [Streptomyces sp. SID8379]
MSAAASRRLKVAVAGLGAIARTAHLPLLERRQDLFEITALCDLSPTALAELGDRHGVPADRRHTTTDALLAAGGFDAVLLLTGGSHGDVAEAALRGGHAVFCEKPLAFTRAEVERVAAAERAQDNGPRLMVGYMKQYDPAAVRLVELLQQAGGAETVRSVEVTVLHPTSEAQLAFAHLPAPAQDTDRAVLDALRAADTERTDEALGTDAPERLRSLYHIVLGSICHDLSLLRLVDGAPESVDLVAMWPKDANPGSVELTGRLAHGARYSIRWHFLTEHAAYRETVAVHHETGSLELAFPAPYLMNAPTVLTATDAAAGMERRARFTSPVEAFEQELAAFYDMVVNGTQPRTGVAGALDDLTTAQRAAARFATQHQLPCAGEAKTA